ncbi:MAG: chromophore lyase CpcT/CpeT [Oceanicaulis sp.]
MTLLAALALIAHPNGVSPERLATALEGRWDNAAQIEAEGDPARPRLHVRHARFESDAAPGVLVYAELDLGGPGGETYRQRVYAFSEGDTEGEVVMAVYEFADPAAFEEAGLDRLAGLRAADLVRFNPGCDFSWYDEGALWRGEVADDTCRITSSRSGVEMLIGAEFTVAGDRFTHSEFGRDAASGAPVFGPPGGVANAYDRVGD